MTDTESEYMAEVGFTPPETRYRKQDPRGSEYGYYTAEYLPEGRIKLSRYRRFPIEVDWECIFTHGMHFQAWASENT